MSIVEKDYVNNKNAPFLIFVKLEIKYKIEERVI